MSRTALVLAQTVRAKRAEWFEDPAANGQVCHQRVSVRRAMRSDKKPDRRLWKGTLAGAGAAAFFGLSAASKGSSVAGSLLTAGMWGSLLFFAVAGVRRNRNVSAGLRRLSASERKAFRRSWRMGVLPDEPSIRTVAVASAEWLSEPAALELSQLLVMGAWLVVACVGAIVVLAEGDWNLVGRWAAFGGLPALAFAATLYFRHSRRRARRMLAPNVADDDRKGAAPSTS